MLWTASSGRCVSEGPLLDPFSAERSIAECGDSVPGAIGQYISFDAALKEIVRRLQEVQRRDATKPLHLTDRKIADTDRANLSLF